MSGGDELAALRTRVAELERTVSELAMRLDDNGPRFAARYSDFTDEFRGSREEVIGKLRGYLPDVRRLIDPGDADPTGEPRVVDVGPGRGEWLDLLRENHVRACGVDTHPDFVADAQARGLDVRHADAIDYLRGRTAGAADLVTAFQVIEHLDVETLLALFEASREALRPGGCLLVETPNPLNLAMGACNFYLDPTHRRPLPPRLTAYLVGAAGFVDVEVRPLNPAEPPWNPTAATPVEEVVGQMIFGPRDYAVFGYRPT